MKWQWKLGRFAGIDVYVHATFLLLIGWLGLSYWLESHFGAIARSVRLFGAPRSASWERPGGTDGNQD